MAKDKLAHDSDGTDTASPARALQTASNGLNGDATAMTTKAVDFLDKADYRDYERASGTGQRQPMRGFYPEYTDIVDYIVRCTHKMWEEGGAGLLYDHYAQNTKVWSDWGYTFGRDQTLGYIAQRFAGFPDWRIYADEVIWAGDDTEGFRTYHRAVQSGHNTSWTKYGPATGKRVQFRGVAFCIARDNYISEEWLVHDELTIVRQLGLDVDDTLRHLAQAADKVC